jgi:hypothetical protein
MDMVNFEASLPSNSLNSWWSLGKIGKISTYLDKVTSISDINKVICLECLKPKTFQINEYQNVIKYKDIPTVCKQFFNNNGEDNLYVFDQNLFDKIKDLLILTPIFLNGNVPVPADSFYERKPTGKIYIYGIYEYHEYSWVRICPGIYKTQDTTNFNGYPQDASPINCPASKIRLKVQKSIPSLPYCTYISFNCECDTTQILNRPLDRYGNPLLCFENNYAPDTVVLNPNSVCPKQTYKCSNISSLCHDAKNCNSKTFAAVNVNGSVISYNQAVPATARCPAGYFAESCENDIAICKPCYTIDPGSSSPKPCEQDHFKCRNKCSARQYGDYVGNNECVCKKCTNYFEKPESLFKYSKKYKILNIGKNIQNPCYTRTLNQKRVLLDLLYPESNLYYILIDGAQLACVDNNTICNFGIPEDLSYPIGNYFGTYSQNTIFNSLTEYQASMISNYISSLTDLVNDEYFDNITIENCQKCNLIRKYLSSLNSFLYDLIFNYSVSPENLRSNILNIFKNPPFGSRLGYMINDQTYNDGENNLFIKMKYAPRAPMMGDKVNFKLKLYKGLSKKNICSIC